MFGLDNDDTLRFVYLAALLVLLVGSVGIGRGRRAGQLRHLGIWLLIVGALIAVYTYREPVLELARPVLAELTPSRAVTIEGPDGEQSLAIRRSNDGHFHLDATVNGTPVRFLIDTGASTTVLSAADAKRVGIDPKTLSFDRPVQTANGTAFYASAWLHTLVIGPYRLASVPVGIMPEGAMDMSLLGMNTINRFSSWGVQGDKMVLTP
jgi:aspartyl protease family protein